MSPMLPATVAIVSWLEKRGKFVQPELTRTQKRSLRETFQTIDTAGSGHIKRHELFEAFGALGLSVSEQKVNDILGKEKENSEGTVGFLEFLHLMTTVLQSQDIKSVAKPARRCAASDSSVPLQLLATAYRRRKTLDGVMHDDAFRRRLIRQSEQDLARAEEERLGHRRMSYRFGVPQHQGLGFDLGLRDQEAEEQSGQPATPSSGSSSSSSSHTQQQPPLPGLVLEIDVGMDFSDDSEDFQTPYWKTRRTVGTESTQQSSEHGVTGNSGITLPTPRHGFRGSKFGIPSSTFTYSKGNPWPQPGESPKWNSTCTHTVGKSKPSEHLHLSKNSFVSRIVPVGRRHGALSSLPVTKGPSQMNGRISTFGSPLLQSPAWDPQRDEDNDIETWTKSCQGPVHSYLCRHRDCSTGYPSRSSSVAQKRKSRSKSTEPWENPPRQVSEHLPKLPRYPEVIREMTIQRPNAYKSHIRLKALKGIQRSVSEMCS